MPPRCPRGLTSRRRCRAEATISRITSQKTSTSRRGAGHDLEDPLQEDEHEQGGDVEAVREERAVAGVRVLLGADAARGEQNVVGIPGQKVAPARPAVREQAFVADQGSPLDLRAVV